MKLIERPRPWRRLLDNGTTSQTFTIITPDNWRLVLRRLKPARITQPTPVMMLHGLAANHLSFHFTERSVARWFADRGWDVWIPELRGHGDSETRAYNWGLDEYLLQDIPTIIDAILERTGKHELHWVGHSMGGILRMCYAGLHTSAPIARSVTVASALDYRIGQSGFERFLSLKPLAARFEMIPYGGFVHMLAPAAGRRGRRPEQFHVWPDNIEPQLVRRMYARCFHAIPTSLLISLSTTFDDRGFRLRDGSELLHGAKQLDEPMLMIAGSKDSQVSSAAVAHAAEHIGDNARVVNFGQEHGHEFDYGHFDLLIGRNAPEEVWPTIEDFLSEH